MGQCEEGVGAYVLAAIGKHQPECLQEFVRRKSKERGDSRILQRSRGQSAPVQWM
jgi:hypothetical protein